MLSAQERMLHVMQNNFKEGNFGLLKESNHRLLELDLQGHSNDQILILEFINDINENVDNIRAKATHAYARYYIHQDLHELYLIYSGFYQRRREADEQKDLCNAINNNQYCKIR